MDSKEIINIIYDLNIEMSEHLDDNIIAEHSLYFEYRTTGFIDIIMFCDTMIWSSDDDEREYDEKTDEYEDLYGFLLKRLDMFSRCLSEASKNMTKTKE